MKSIRLSICCGAVLSLLITGCATNEQASGPAQQTATKVGQLTASEIQERRIYRRAVEAAIWSQPLIGTHQTRAAVRAAGGDYNSVIYLSRP